MYSSLTSASSAKRMRAVP
jgi:hypothetical protein